MPRASRDGTDGIVFCRKQAPFRQITVADDYRFDDIQPGDRVLDIGANVGAFCIRAARLGGIVTAVEPVAAEILKENIRANQVPVQVVECALGIGQSQEISWDDCRVIVPTYPLSDLIAMSGGCDFLKCDCEGAEWSIRPEELRGVRRIEMELHLPPISGPPSADLLEYIGQQYNFTIDRKPCHDVLGVMGILHAIRK